MFPLNRFIVRGHSMEPLFKEGERVIINRLAYLFTSPKPNDIIAFRTKDQGESILLKKIDRVLGNDQFFLVGSNKNDSLDSSSFGPIKRPQILGKVLLKY